MRTSIAARIDVAVIDVATIDWGFWAGAAGWVGLGFLLGVVFMAAFAVSSSADDAPWERPDMETDGETRIAE